MPKDFIQGLSAGAKDLLSGSLTGLEKEANNSIDIKMSDLVAELQSRGVYDRINYGSGWDTGFSRIGIIDPYNSSLNNHEYVFFVKPDLHLFSGEYGNPELTQNSPFFLDCLGDGSRSSGRYIHVAEQLAFSHRMHENGGPLSPLLSNAFIGNLELPDISADTIDTPQNVYGTKMEYRGSSYKSDEGFDFSCDFTDTKYLEVYMWFKMYDEYEKMKGRGQVTPTKDDYIVYKNLHDQMAIYKFIVGDDGMSLIYWARIMGAFPKSVPRDTFSKLDDGPIQYSTSWHGQFVRDMDPAILADFNNIMASYRGNNFRILPLYDTTHHRFDPTWAKCPVIATRKSDLTKMDKLNKYYFLWVV